jgi:hypothetical protein
MGELIWDMYVHSPTLAEGVARALFFRILGLHATCLVVFVLIISFFPSSVKRKGLPQITY